MQHTCQPAHFALLGALLFGGLVLIGGSGDPDAQGQSAASRSEPSAGTAERASRESPAAQTGDGSRERDQRRLPNVVIFLIDTLRADRLHLYGFEKDTSPFMDQLARESVVFDACHAPAPWTLPSVVSLLTSTFPCEHGVLVDGQRLSPSLTPLAERLQKLNYATAALVCNPFAGPTAGLERGLDIYQFHPTWVAPSVVDDLLKKVPSLPFFMYIHNMEPHHPYRLPPWVRGTADVGPEARKQLLRLTREYRVLSRAAGNPGGPVENSGEQQQKLDELNAVRETYEALYQDAVSMADQHLKETVEILKRRNLWNDTVFIVTADHGEEMGDHGGWLHDQSVYQELVHVPLIIHFPEGKFAGTRVRNPVSLVDILPTIADCIRTPALAADCRGTSVVRHLAPHAAGPTGEPAVTGVRINRRKHFLPYKLKRGDVNVVLRQGAWKGIWNAEIDTFELYDLAEDPREMCNMADEQPDVASTMRKHAQAWLAQCGAAGDDSAPEQASQPDAETMRVLKSLGYVD
jgi:arylsulfatase A-like enzyme